MIWYITLIDILGLFLALITVIYSFKNWKSSKININLFLMFFIVFLTLSTLRNIFIELNPVLNITIGANLTISGFISNLLVLVALQFFFYLKNWETLYTLPIVSAFVLIASLYLILNDLINLAFAVIVFIVILYDSIKTKNGIELGLSFTVLYTISLFPANDFLLIIIYASLRLASMLFVLLGISGIIDRIIFLDEEEEDKIKNTWIARMT
ncbi:MAG: hypothetical protein GF317_08890 [Candidatus Lokiarchaeota archaeon]|nr:hypothetical protein [Candidatus Lokiarchaeota archaeon]MBD3199827.1 hypothetical protein [Candidatus Lokiarchaeota archaeon]